METQKLVDLAISLTDLTINVKILVEELVDLKQLLRSKNLTEGIDSVIEETINKFSEALIENTELLMVEEEHIEKETGQLPTP